jgi:hypothetical protein
MRRKTKYLAQGLGVGSAALLGSWLTSPEPAPYADIELVAATESVLPTPTLIWDALEPRQEIELRIVSGGEPLSDSDTGSAMILNVIVISPTTTVTTTTTELPFTTSEPIPTDKTNTSYCNFPEGEPWVCYASAEEALENIVTTTTTLPSEISRLAATREVTRRTYSMNEKGDDIKFLQQVLGVFPVDGTYGPATREAHMQFLGGPEEAIHTFFPEFNRAPLWESKETLEGLVDKYFLPEDKQWALKVAFCESSALPHHTINYEVSSALAIGWFQHLAKYWTERSESAGWPGADPFEPEANVAVAAWLLYEGGGTRHWNPSRSCWIEN